MSDGFHLPDWSAPLDVAAHLHSCPPDVTVKGMYFNDALQHVARVGASLPTTKTYLAFKSYPNRELIELLIACAQLAYPHDPIREALRRLGRGAYPVLAESMIGRVIFGVLRKDLSAMFRVAAKGYAVSLSAGRAELVDVKGTREQGQARLRLIDIYNFIDCYQVGVLEGAILSCDRQGSVKVRLESPFVGELLATWDSP